MVWEAPAGAPATFAVITEGKKGKKKEAKNAHWDPDELCTPPDIKTKTKKVGIVLVYARVSR